MRKEAAKTKNASKEESEWSADDPRWLFADDKDGDESSAWSEKDARKGTKKGKACVSK